MSRDNIIAILGILKTAYPRFYANMTKTKAEETISLWQEMFSDTESLIITIAIKRLITHLEFPPTIADVKKEILEITQENKKEIDYWQEAFKMMCNANYMTIQEFQEYPDMCRRFFGSLSNLKSYGTMERENVINNIQPRFLRFAETYKKEEKENLLLPTVYKNMIEKLVSNVELKCLEE